MTIRRFPAGAGLLAVAALALLAGCGDASPPPPELPGFEQPRGPSELTVTLQLTFTRDEEPVAVPRTVVLPLDPETLSDDTLLLRVALEALVAGPTPEEEARGITSFFSSETAGILESVELVGDSALVAFSDFRGLMPGASSSAGSFAFLAELNGTIFALPGIARVEYRMEGSCDAFWAFLQRSCQEIRRPSEA